MQAQERARASSGRRAVALGAIWLAALTTAACTSDSSSSGSSTTAGTAGTGTTVTGPTGTAAPGEPGIPIPPPTTVASTVAPVVTTPEGGPAVVEYAAPDTFRCQIDGAEAQITVGWSVPSATAVTILLDGTSPPVGIQDAIPYQVPGGPITGPGSTIVFPCAPDEHTIAITWSMGDATTARTFTITKVEGTA